MTQTRRALTAALPVPEPTEDSTETLEPRCSHGQNGLSEACSECVHAARQENYLLGQAVGFETAAAYIMTLAKTAFQQGRDGDAQGLRTLASQVQHLRETHQTTKPPGETEPDFGTGVA